MKIGSLSNTPGTEKPVQRPAEGAAPVQAPQPTSKAPAPQEPVKGAEDHGAQPEFSEEWMKKSVDQANKALAQHNRYIEREVHETTHAVMYKIKDTVTNEVIAEYPPKKIQDMIAKMWELAGLFVDEKA